MMPLNSHLAQVAEPAIIAVNRWLDGMVFPPDRPLINLCQAAPTAPPPEPMRSAMARALEQRADVHLYGSGKGEPDLLAALAGQTSALYGATVDAAEVSITAGCNQAFCVAISSLCGPGDAVMLPYPWYFNHKMWLDMNAIECVPLPCDGAMLPDLEAARAAMHDRVKAIVLVTPNNPTGAEYPDGLLGVFYDLAKDNDCALVVDETYRDFHSGTGAPHTLFQRPDWRDTLIHLYSFSKAYRMTGHRVGAIIAGGRLLAEIEKYMDALVICITQIAQVGATFGLEHLGDFVAEERAEYLRRKAALAEGFATRLQDWKIHGLGAYFAWATPPGGMDSETAARRLLAEQSILVLPGAMFLPDGADQGALRIAFANADVDGIGDVVERLTAFQP